MDYADRHNAENVIIIGRVGENCGNVFYEKGKCWVSDNAIYGTCEGNAYLFFYYTLKTMQLNNSTEGTGQPLLTQDILYRKLIVMPKNMKIVNSFENLIIKLHNQDLLARRDIDLCDQLKETMLGKMAK